MLSLRAALLDVEGVKGFSANLSPWEGHKEGDKGLHHLLEQPHKTLEWA